MKEIHFATDFGYGKVYPGINSEHSKCYICNDISELYIDYMVGTHTLLADLKIFEEIFKKNNLKYFVVEKDEEEVTVRLGACSKHLKNLKDLEKAVKENKDMLSKDMIKKNIQ
jgi:hypothetical protein